MKKIAINMMFFGLCGIGLTACNEPKTEKIKEPAKPVSDISEGMEGFVHEYLTSRFNGSDVSSLGAPRIGLRISVKKYDRGWIVTGLDHPSVLKTPQYLAVPMGGPYEFPNVIWADRATSDSLKALQTNAIGSFNETSNEWIIGMKDEFDFGTYSDGSLKSGADICPRAARAFTAKIVFSKMSAKADRTVTVAICMSDVKLEGGINAEKVPYIQTVITEIE